LLTIDLAGKRALVTGAGQGVGREIAWALAQAGAQVVVNDLIPVKCEAVAAELSSTGAFATALPFDVSNIQDVQRAFDRSKPIDILINNAGNRGGGRFELAQFAESDPADWEPFIRVNLHGVMVCTRYALPGMIERGYGRIITIISDAARVGDAKMAAYAAAKAGAAGFTRSVATEVGAFGVTANCISLGTMRTPLTGMDLEQSNPELVKSLLKSYVIRRRGESTDVTGLVALLASPMASWITGQTIPVNGGRSMAI
jgi:NAD(P)-dependent dehydrogenase (short-subunit alcohol dehydrogenase family)